MPSIGQIYMPYYDMGAVNSTHLFGLDELILFYFYGKTITAVYEVVADLGANIGLHSIVMRMLGATVKSYEPDPAHFAKLQSNMRHNNLEISSLYQEAVSDKAGVAEFTRVRGNTTGSHLTGSKPSPYGPWDKFQVQTARFKDVIRGVQLAKIDVEGHEAKLIASTVGKDWNEFDCIVEIGSKQNRDEIYAHCNLLKINIFSQKLGWTKAKCKEELPSSYKEGSIFLSRRPRMPW